MRRAILLTMMNRLKLRRAPVLSTYHAPDTTTPSCRVCVTPLDCPRRARTSIRTQTTQKLTKHTQIPYISTRDTGMVDMRVSHTSHLLIISIEK